MEGRFFSDRGGVRFAGVGDLVDAGVVLAMDVGVFDSDLGVECVFGLDAGDLDRERKLPRIIVAAMDGGVLDFERSIGGVLALDGVLGDE